MERFGLEELKDVEIIKPNEHPRFQEFYVNITKITNVVASTVQWHMTY